MNSLHPRYCILLYHTGELMDTLDIIYVWCAASLTMAFSGLRGNLLFFCFSSGELIFGYDPCLVYGYLGHFLANPISSIQALIDYHWHCFFLGHVTHTPRTEWLPPPPPLSMNSTRFFFYSFLCLPFCSHSGGHMPKCELMEPTHEFLPCLACRLS